MLGTGKVTITFLNEILYLLVKAWEFFFDEGMSRGLTREEVKRSKLSKNGTISNGNFVIAKELFVSKDITSSLKISSIELKDFFFRVATITSSVQASFSLQKST